MKTVGTATLKKSIWEIEAQPHALIRLKRLFGRAAKEHGKVRLKNTEEVCRDLVWFCQRFPLEVTPRDVMEGRARAFDERAQAVEDLLSGKIDPRPFDLAIPARTYQRVAADMALRSGGLLIADEVGIGKTVTAICTLMDPETRPALVVTLAHLPRQWERELHRFAPGLKVHVVRKGTPYDVTRRRRTPKGQLSLVADSFPDVLIMNYHKLAGWADALAPKIRTVVFDEVQELRRRESNKYKAAQHFAEQAALRIGLSATPIYNLGGEMWSVLNVLCPGGLGTWTEFIREWCGGMSNQGKAKVQNPKAFGLALREQGLMIRRTRTDVGRELPELTKVIHHVEADAKALDDVADAAAELAKIILAQGGKGLTKMRASEELDWRLRQATGIAKAPYIAEFVRMLVDNGEKVVLYAWHREVHSLLRARLSSCTPVFYTGTESAAAKERSLHAFTQGDAKVLIISLRSGAGLDGLQGYCRTIVFGELDWSPGIHEQCIGRVHRDGQGEPCVAYFLLSDTGSDPVVADALGLKRAQAEGVQDPEGALVEKLAAKTDVKKLAAAYLEQRGIPLPAESAA